MAKYLGRADSNPDTVENSRFGEYQKRFQLRKLHSDGRKVHLNRFFRHYAFRYYDNNIIRCEDNEQLLIINDDFCTKMKFSNFSLLSV